MTSEESRYDVVIAVPAASCEETRVHLVHIATAE